MEQNNTNEIDLRKIVRILLEHWWWFALGVVCFTALGLAYYMRKSPQWTTDASIMLRQKEGIGDQLTALSTLGLAGNSAAEDEVVVLSSRGLMYQALDALNLWEPTFVKEGLRWKGEFRNPAISVEYLELTDDAKINPFSVYVKPVKSGYKVRTRRGFLTYSFFEAS